MSKFQVIVTNKVKIHKRKPGALIVRFKRKKDFENYKFASCLFVKGGTTDENFKRCFNVEYCSGTQKEMM